MTIKFEVPGKERKRLVQTLAAWLGSDVKYNGAPSFSYEVERFTVGRDGDLTFDGKADDEVIERLLEHLYDEGFQYELPAAEAEENPADEEREADGMALTVIMPLAKVNTANLTNLLEAKGTLIRKALGAEDLRFDIGEEFVSFPWFGGRALDSDEIKAYTHFISALCAMTCEQKRINAHEKPVDNEKYAFRCFLLRLGFIGADYKTERKILLRNLTGSAAFKSGAKGGREDDVSE